MKQLVNRYAWNASALVLLWLLFFVPYVCAGMSSTNYALTQYGIGSTERSDMSSTNYTLKHRVVAQAQGVPTVEPDTQGDTRTTSGSRGQMLSIIAASTTSFGVRDIPQGLPAVITVGPDDSLSTIEAGDALTVINTPHEVSTTDSDTAEVDSAAFDLNNQVASVIGANLLDDRSDRIIIFMILLAALFYVRTYTKIGKRYRPF